jgi:hypothetical protein
VVFGEWFGAPGGVVFPETVQVIPLFLEFSTLQVCQIIYVVYIVKIVSVRLDAKLVREVLLQQMAVRLVQTCEAAEIAPLLSIPDNGLQDRQNIALAQGEGVHGPPVKLGLQHQKTVQKGGSLPSPNGQIDKGKFAALAAMKKITVIFIPPCRVKLLKCDHK